MYVAKAAIYLLLPLLVMVMVPGQGCGQSGTPGTKLRANVQHDTETMVSSASRWRYREGVGQGQCSPNGVPDLQLVAPPKHGTVRFITTDVGIPKGSGCPNSVYGQAVMYRPDLGFVGKDQFTYNVPDDPMAFVHLG